MAALPGSDGSPDTTNAPQAWKTSYQPSELADIACPGCTSRAFDDIATEFGLAISRCLECGLVYTRTPLAASQAHYLVDRSDYLAKYESVFRGEASHPRDPNYEEQLRLLERFRPPGDLLDVGSHCGFFLRKARDRGWRATGVEPSPTSSSLAREQLGLDVRTGSLQSACFPSGSFDAVTLIDVLEHVENPRSLLTEVARVLRPGGILFAKVPSVRYSLLKHYVLRRIPGAVDDVFDPREHTVHYSRRTLAQVLVASGFVPFKYAVPTPIQTGGRLRRLVRSLGPFLARLCPRGFDLPVATDIVVLARTHGNRREASDVA